MPSPRPVELDSCPLSTDKKGTDLTAGESKWQSTSSQEISMPFRLPSVASRRASMPWCLPLWLSLSSTLAFTGCASLPSSSQDCRQARLDPAPAWMAGATWDRKGERLAFVDPGSKDLLLFDADGSLIKRAGKSELERLDLHHPVRLEASGNGFLIGDRHELVWLDRDLDRAQSTFAGIDGVQNVFLGDWARRGKDIVAFVDVEVDGETWSRGFARLEPPEKYTLLHEMPLDSGDEYSRYYDYGLRPYVVTAGRHTYLLRYEEPTTLYRAGRDRLERLWRIDDQASRLEGAARGKETLIGWQGNLYLLERVRLPELDEDEMDAPQPIAATPSESQDESPSGIEIHRPMLEAAKLVKRSRNDWYLSRLDTSKGGRHWRRRLLAGAGGGLKVVPGPKAWALVNSGGTPSPTEAKPLDVLFVDVSRIKHPQGADICSIPVVPSL